MLKDLKYEQRGTPGSVGAAAAELGSGKLTGGCEGCLGGLDLDPGDWPRL